MRLRRAEFAWGQRTYVMGVLNATPDSFSGDGLGRDLAAVLARARWMVEGGADILDIGGESTRPGAGSVPEQLELARVLPVVRAVRAELDVPLSIDTYKASVAAAALDAGADMVNDVWALQRDPRLAAVVAERGVPVVLMDNCSNAAALRHDRRLGGHYAADEEADVVADVTGRIRALVENARLEGISPSRILVDPGIGFGKSRSQNLALLDGLEELGRLGYPVLVGPSRKSFIGLTLDAPPEDRVEGTAAAVAIAIARGADIVRVHDVTAMCRVARMTDAIVRRGGAETSGEAGGTITAR